MAMIQIRGVSDEAHRRLKARAALEGRSLSEYLRLEVERLAALPTMEEMIERVAARDPVDLGEPAAEIVGRERRSREAQLTRARRSR
jgi:plasmid stability protein